MLTIVSLFLFGYQWGVTRNFKGGGGAAPSMTPIAPSLKICQIYVNKAPILFFQFFLLPFGSLSGFIAKAIDKFFNEKHLEDMFIVDNYEDQCALIDAANSHGITLPEIIK